MQGVNVNYNQLYDFCTKRPDDECIGSTAASGAQITSQKVLKCDDVLHSVTLVVSKDMVQVHTGSKSH